MIICVSVNPAIDRRVLVTGLRVGEVNRAISARPAPGGKAAHVAMAAKALGEAVAWVGFLGGSTGIECEHGLTALGIPVEVIHTKSSTRINQEIVDQQGITTELLEPGGHVDECEIGKMTAACGRLFDFYGSEAQVVISGSLSPGIPITFYGQLIEAARRRGCHVLLDTSGDALLASLASAPNLIKPNCEEAARALEQTVNDMPSAYEAAREFMRRGAKSVALSLGSEGLLWLESFEAEPLVFRAPAVIGRSTVGCGDATMAGFAVARFRHLDYRQQAALAVACGAANCLAESPGMIDVEQVVRIRPLVEVEELANTLPAAAVSPGLQ